MLSVPAGGGVRRHLSMVAKTQYCAVVVSRGRLVSGYSLPPTCAPGRECPLISCVMRPVLTAAESAVMHIISSETIEADTILSIWYTRYRFRYDTNPIIVRSLIWTYERLAVFFNAINQLQNLGGLNNPKIVFRPLPFKICGSSTAVVLLLVYVCL